MNIGKDLKLTRVMNAVAAGTTAQASSEIDMQGYDGVLFVSAFGALTATAVTSVKLQQDTATGMSSAADLEGSSQSLTATTHNNMCVMHDLFRPRERFVRAYISRGTANAVIDGVVAIQYMGSEAPAVNDATTVVALKTLISPAEGTA